MKNAGKDVSPHKESEPLVEERLGFLCGQLIKDAKDLSRELRNLRKNLPHFPRGGHSELPMALPVLQLYHRRG